jgi:type IV pilus assembly protein PilX
MTSTTGGAILMTAKNKWTSPAGERGVALIVGLIILAVLSLIGVAAFSITTQEERMAGNSRDRIRAFEAAEASLRDCENAAATGGPAIFGTAAGMYVGPTSSATASIAENQPESTFWQNKSNSNQVRQLTTFTSFTATNGNAFPPSCVAELITLQPVQLSPGNPLSSVNAVNIAHVTAHGYGVNPNTVVSLESYYAI